MKTNVNENPQRAKSQTDRILNYMSEGRTITPGEALNLFGCMRLGARIADIKKKGFIVYSDFVNVPTKDGGTARVKQYHI